MKMYKYEKKCNHKMILCIVCTMCYASVFIHKTFIRAFEYVI